MSRKSASSAPALADTRDESVWVVDETDRPIAVMALGEVHRQRLRHRSVLVTVFDRDGRVYLQRRAKTKSSFPGCFDLSATGHARAFESRQDAAIRELGEELGIEASGLTYVASAAASPQTGFEFVTLFTAGTVTQTPCPDPVEIEDGFFATSEDVEDLVAHFRDMLTPALLHCHEHGLLFARGRAGERAGA